MNKPAPSGGQLLFREMFVGTLVYAVVLGFFNDYTTIVVADSFSTLFIAAFVLQVLTYATLRLKGWVVARFRHHKGAKRVLPTALFVWLILFSSKFVFIWVVDAIFGSKISIFGFFGVLKLVVAVAAVLKLESLLYTRLGSGKNEH